MIKNGRVRGQTGDRQRLDMLLQCAAGEEIAGNVIEPKTLAKIIQKSCCFHGFVSLAGSRIQARRNWSNRGDGPIECQPADIERVFVGQLRSVLALGTRR